MLWAVHIEYRAPVDWPDEDLEVMEDRVSVLTDHLRAAAVGVSARSYAVTFDVEASDGYPVTELGVKAADDARDHAGLPAWPAVRYETVLAELQESELMEPQLPEFVGAQEVGELLGVSRQRVHQLRQESGFPEPLFRLAATPVWPKAAIMAFLGRWDRRPGRRSAAH
jgi:hypothetical protein